MKFTKMHGAGNDFVVIEAEDGQHDWSKLALAMCHRHFGIGADGILLLMPSNKADFRMRVFNADGSEADACGNGLRCLIRYFTDMKQTNPEKQEIFVETLTGVRKAEVYHSNGKISRIQVGMGEPEFREKYIPVTIEQDRDKIVKTAPLLSHSVIIDEMELNLNSLGVGNPHTVFFIRQPVADFPLTRIGPKVERHKIFPRGVNFEIARILSPTQIEARVWERGVGETLACGSGACAITVVARLLGYVNSNTVDIILPGGALGIEWSGKGEVFLSGPTATVFTGEWTEEN